LRYIHPACFNLTPAKDRAIQDIDVSGAAGVSAATAACLTESTIDRRRFLKARGFDHHSA
jgi:hypothetical protein